MKEQLKFRTTINCGGCVAAVTPSLNQSVGEGRWQVDTDNPDKVLTVDAGAATESAVVAAVHKAGFKAEAIGS